MVRNKNSPYPFPPLWAAEWGEDIFGLWTALVYKEVRQVFRWIPPGDFQMGSPEGEKGRYSNEKQHKVTISQGYWLGDTPVTQELWTAVMGDNPSDFTGEDRLPVENISWDDCKGFMEKLNQFHPDLNLDFPTEAKWEYGCRAGAKESLPFSFGHGISLDKANYRGTLEWKGSDEWGKGARKKTTPVGSYPRNDWGLYDMHGNVWEWCRDWYGDYPDGPVLDPMGPEQGVHRVLRGGSWFNYGRYCRSAYRYRDVPGDRYHDIGFRLSPGQSSR